MANNHSSEQFMGTPNTISNTGMSPNDAMLDMMQALDVLRAIYDEENAALETADTRRFMDLQARKIEAAQQYQVKAAHVVDQRDHLKSADSGILKQLEEKHAAFSAMTQKNLAHIERMNKTVKRLSERIVKGARDAALQDSASYSRRGTMYRNARPVSTGLNESA